MSYLKPYVRRAQVEQIHNSDRDVVSRLDSIGSRQDAKRLGHVASFQPMAIANAQMFRPDDVDRRFWENVLCAENEGFSAKSDYNSSSTKNVEVRNMLIKAVEHCESPIEKVLLPWLVYADYGPDLDTFPSPVCLWKGSNDLPATRVFIVPQFAFVKYRADFAVIARHKGQTKIAAVECDGQKFHNARPDRERDRLFSVFGVSTFRASGADIHANSAQFAGCIANDFAEWAAAL